ncbi:1744_t:CDS:2 [Entrophospora sp. SA101]|nr:1744_t:CDS:2 [Entrophospora sp. SA101]
MPETAFIIFFSFKYREALDYMFFWPEDLEEALCKNERDEILERLLLYFLKNLKNQDKLIDPISLHKELMSYIDTTMQEDKDTYTRVNPLKNVENFYKLSVRDKVQILKDMVIKQFYVSTKIKELAKARYPTSKRNNTIPFDVEKLGSDSDGSKYYYVGIGSRIYKESIVNDNNVSWSVSTTTVEDVANLEKHFEKRLMGIPPDQQHTDEKSFYQNLQTIISPIIWQTLEKEQKLPRETRLRIYKVRQSQLIQKKIELSKKDNYNESISPVHEKNKSESLPLREDGGILEINANASVAGVSKKRKSIISKESASTQSIIINDNDKLLNEEDRKKESIIIASSPKRATRSEQDQSTTIMESSSKKNKKRKVTNKEVDFDSTTLLSPEKIEKNNLKSKKNNSPKKGKNLAKYDESEITDAELSSLID